MYHIYNEIQNVDYDVDVCVISNGCTDSTGDLLEKNCPNYDFIHLDLFEGSKIKAMNFVANKFQDDYELIAFMDDDVKVFSKGIIRVIEELNSGYCSVSLAPKGQLTERGLIKRFWQNVFKMSSEYMFLNEPKKYMVGRFMGFRLDKWVDIPENMIHDDAWLTRIHWPKVLVIADSYVYYIPSSNPLKWFKRYIRNIVSLEQMKEEFPSKNIKYALKPKVVYSRLFKIKYFPDSLYFFIYRCMSSTEKTRPLLSTFL